MRAKIAPALTLNRLFIVAWAIVLGFLFVLAIDSFTATFSVDQAIFVYVTKGILQGEVPYLDRWDHKGPLIYIINLIGLIIDENWGDVGRFRSYSCSALCGYPSPR